MNRETRVGMIAFCIILLLAAGSFFIPVKKLLFRDTFTVTAEVSNAGGISPDARVTYSGVLVGKVTRVAVRGDTAVLTLDIRNDAAVPADAECRVGNDALIGEPSVMITGGSPDAGYLSEGSVIREKQDNRMQELMAKAQKLMDTASKTQENWQKFTNAGGSSAP